MTPQYSHKGWFGLCPIYFEDRGDAYPAVAPRWEWVVPLFWLSLGWQALGIAVRSRLVPGYVPVFYFRLTGEL